MTFACGFSLPVAPSLKGKGKHCGGAHETPQSCACKSLASLGIRDPILTPFL